MPKKDSEEVDGEKGSIYSMNDKFPWEPKRHLVRDLGECSNVVPILKEKLVNLEDFTFLLLGHWMNDEMNK